MGARPGPTPGCVRRQAPTPTGNCLARAEQPSATRQRAVPSGGHGPGWAGLLSLVGWPVVAVPVSPALLVRQPGPCRGLTQSAVYVHSYVSDRRPQPVPVCRVSVSRPLAQLFTPLYTLLTQTTDIIIPGPGKNFH